MQHKVVAVPYKHRSIADVDDSVATIATIGVVVGCLRFSWFHYAMVVPLSVCLWGGNGNNHNNNHYC